MSVNTDDPAVRAQAQAGHHHGSGDGLTRLALGAIGVVYGDIGTSPLYAMKEVFVGHHPLAVDPLHIFGVISLVFWSLMLIVTLKYVLIILRADNNGEGGSLALLALIQRRFGYMDAAARIKPTRDAVRDEWRKSDVLAKVDAVAHAAGIDRTLVARLYEDLIETSIAHELGRWDSIRSS